MKPNNYIFFIAAFSIFLFFQLDKLQSQQYSYIGSEKCSECHSEKGIGDQSGKWAASPHSRAYLRLKTEDALMIGQKLSIEKPWENKKCLKCHTTGGGSDKNMITEGVGCESCHGPGSAYHKPNIHVDFTNRRNGYGRAKKNGMYPILDFEPNLKNREKLCMSCHHFRRPCGPTTIAEKQKQKISIHVIDTLKKGSLDFNHKLRRY